MSDIVGIDLGTTNSLIGVVESGFPILLADDNGERLTPSAVYFPDGAEPIIGRAALRARSVAPQRVVSSIKRLMGSAQRAGPLDLSPEEISALILRQLKGNAEHAVGREVTRAVITVPAYFNDAQRNATKRAGELAGFTVERILNEPTAAALAFALDRGQAKARIAVYDFGGGTFDLSILQLNDGLFEVRATNGNTQLGGDDIDAAIISHFAPEFSELSPEQAARLREAAIELKHRLSFEENASVELPFYCGAESLRVQLTRSELDRISQPIIDKTRWHCARALADARLKPEELDEVILVGGATRMPLVRDTVREIFGREPNTSPNPDEAVAIGATIQAGVLAGAISNVLLLDVTPLSLGLETFGGLMNVIIPRNSTIPIKAGEMFTTAVNNQRAMSIKVLQGEREMARDNWQLGQFEIEFEPAPKGMPRVGVQFEIDANGILHVLARDTRTGAERVLELKSAVDVSDEAVEKMLGDSLEHAFEDMTERTWTEAALKAEEMLRAVESIMTQSGAGMSETERAQITWAMSEMREALASKTPARLQRANAVLDEATQGLAALILEQAIR
ncbi:MAG: Hsp70 family protein [Verrucomicrobia bacterium]|nr:Hsp70 family protein [Verrucomicrobiota bacterium]